MKHPLSMTFLHLVLLTLLPLTAIANNTPYRTFYVDSKSGDDRHDGRSIGNAWQSLDRVNSAELRPGDTVRLKRDGQWRGSLVPTSGDANAPITYTSYGEGQKPLLLGSKSRGRVDDWVGMGDGVWATLPMEYRQVQQRGNMSQSIWQHHQESGADVRLTQSQSDEGTVLQIHCTNSGQKSNHVQLWGPEIPIEKGTFLQLNLRVRCSIPFHLSKLDILHPNSPWTRYASANVDRDITTQWQDTAAVFYVDQSSTSGRLHLSLGGSLPTGATFELMLGELHAVTPTVEDPLDADVGNIIFDHGDGCGWKKWSVDSLEKPYDYYYDGASQRIFLKSETNPATLHKSIECAIKRHVIDQSNTHHVVYDGLAVMYGAAHGFGGGNTEHIVIRNVDLGYIGGGHQHTRPNGQPVRYGNAIEFWGSASNHLVENCRIWEVYDAALTNQNNTTPARQENIVYRNNLIWNCEYSFEYWNHPETSVTRNIHFLNNTCINAGFVWSHAQRPDPNGSHLMFYSNTAATSGVEVKHNIFFQASDWGSRYTGGWKTLPEMNHNLWYSDSGIMAWMFQEKLASFEDYQKATGLDSDSIFADPKFVAPEQGDYCLSPDSPARKLRAGVMKPGPMSQMTQ
ncbi:hypothetical protein CA13_16950 [Planctomycetes bacterium CA13]|uniref:Right handed beta helix domain-containing protein n=1 Tax=Novipirellula herctigrandis TaxID=2527986 RepID=A0A5C5YYW1_9BACT|nr:hypothetical protein CA13_16950 [Planctomycetes bacterium CA13]